MSPYFSEEHELFRASARDFIAKEIRPHIDTWEKAAKIPRSIFKKMGTQGFLGINYPEKYLGSDVDFFYSVIWLEELARSGAGGFSAAVSVHQYMATAHIAEAGSEALKQKYLVPSIKGSAVGALAISEPETGSDVANIRTTATRDGDDYLINGSKIFITNGVYSDFVVVACKTQPNAGIGGISLIVVDRNTPGFTANKLEKLGWNCSDTGELFFDHVRVPASNLVGEEGLGFYYIMDSFQLERLVGAVGAVAGAAYGLELTLKYVQERQAFGRPLNKFQAMRHTLVNLATEIEASKHFAYHAAWLYKQGQFDVQMCSMVKMLTSELANKAAGICLECFGGYGYMETYPMARMYRDAKAGNIAGGTANVMREIIAKTLIDGVHFEPVYRNPQLQNKTTRQGLGNAPSKRTNSKGGHLHGIAKAKPTTAREIILSFSHRFLPQKLREDYETVIHFDLVGKTGGQFTVEIKQSKCHVFEGLHGKPKCLVNAQADVYEGIELGRDNAQMAFMMGKVKVNNIAEIMSFTRLFERLY